MAVDTAAKRLSIMGLGSPYRGLPAVPDGSIDRLVPLLLYTGIPAGAAVVPVPGIYTLTHEAVGVYTLTHEAVGVYTLTHEAVGIYVLTHQQV
jgi:hypothetical protein